jgi:hypothetical protein
MGHCGTPDNINSQSTPNNGNLVCNNNFSVFLDNHRDDMMPTGATRTLKMKTNVIFMQNAGGEGNFTMSNPDHAQYWNDVFTEINRKLANLEGESCNCTITPTHYGDVKLEIVPNFIEIQDDFGWNHRNDNDRFDLSSSDKDFLLYISNLAQQDPTYEQGIDVMMTMDGFYYNRYINDNPDGLPYWSTHVGYSPQTSWYQGFWYSDLPNYDLESSAFWHCPDHYLRYINHLEHDFDPVIWLENEPIKAAGGFLHEYGHYFFPVVGHQHSCNLNIMNGSYTINRTSFTGCQVRDMYESIMTKKLRKYIVCEDVIDHEIDIVNEEIWSNNIKVFSDIYIKDGGKLTITCELHMQPNTRIIVERGGELVVDEGLLTGCGDYWRGIIVEGDANNNQANSGRVGLINGAVIENARNAISMNPSHMPYVEDVYEGFMGGIVEASNSTIRDCKRAIEFMRFAQGGTKDQSFITNCTFDNLKYGITLWADDGVVIDNCNFNNIQTYAVHSYDTEVIVNNGCTFNNMPEGIYMKSTFQNMFSSKIGAVGTLPNEFNTNVYGIFAEAQSNEEVLEIQNNNFLGGDHGVLTSGLSFSSIHGNDFINQNLSGVTPQDQGGDPNEIYLNNISSSNVGSQAGFDNEGLLYYDNCFGFNTYSDIRVVDGNIGEIQGEAGGPANNCFSHGGTRAVDNSLGSDEVKYWYGNDNNCLNPVSSLNVNEELTQGGVIPTTCGSSFSPGPVNSKFLCYNTITGKGNVINKINEIENYIADIESNTNLSSSYKRYILYKYKRCLKNLLKKYGQEVFINRSDIPSTVEIEEAITFYSQRPEFESKIKAQGIMMTYGDYPRALSYLNSLPTNRTVESDFVIAQRINIAYLMGRENFSLTSSDEILLRSIGEKIEPLNGYARAIYERVTGERIYLPFRGANDITPRESNDEKGNLEIINIYPNPASDHLKIDLGVGFTGNIIITNTTGEDIYNNQVSDASFHIDVSEWMSGIYFLVVNSENYSSEVHKIIIVK